MHLAPHDSEVSPLGWWLLAEESHDPVGPISTGVLLDWVRSGKVPSGALVCEVGRTDWQNLDETAPFSRRRPAPARFDPSSEQCQVDLDPLPAAPAEPREAKTNP